MAGELAAEVEEHQGRPHEALSHARQSHDLYLATGHRTGQARARAREGRCLTHLGEYQQALTCSLAAIAVQCELDRRPRRAHGCPAPRLFAAGRSTGRTGRLRHRRLGDALVPRILGYHQSNGGERTVDMQGWNFRVLCVVSLHNRRTDDILTWMDRAQRSAALGFICPSRLVDRRVNLDELPDVLTNKHEHDAIKTVLCPDADQALSSYTATGPTSLRHRL